MVTVGLHEALQPHLTDIRRAVTRRGYSSIAVAGPAAEVVTRAGVSGDLAAVVVSGAPSADTLRAVSDATELRPALVVVLAGPTAHEVDMLVALASGVAGYLASPPSPVAVVDAIVGTLSGAIIAPPAVTGPLVRLLRTGSRRMTITDPAGRPVTLTSREWEVLVLLRQGRSTGEIAHRLIVAPVTIRSHTANLLQKLHLPTRAHLPTPWPNP